MPFILEKSEPSGSRFSRRSSGIPRPVKHLALDSDAISHASKPSLDPVTPSKKYLQQQQTNVVSQPQAQSLRGPKQQMAPPDLKQLPAGVGNQVTSQKPAVSREPTIPKAKLEADAEVPVLELIPFGLQPFVNFGQVTLGQTQVKHVAIRNLQNSYHQLFIRSFPKADKGFNIDATEFLLAPRAEIVVALSWTPTSVGSIRETITFQHTGRYPSRIVMNGVAVKQKVDLVKSTTKSIFTRRLNHPRFSPNKVGPSLKQTVTSLSRININSKTLHHNANHKPLTKLSTCASNRRQSGQIVKKILSKHDDTMAAKVQSYVRMILAKRKLHEMKIDRDVVVKLQTYARMALARRQLHELRARRVTVIRVQAYARMVLAKWQSLELRNLRETVVKLQAYARMALARRQLKELRTTRDIVIRLQSYARMAQAKRQLQELRARRDAAIIIQSHARTMFAKRQLQELKNRRDAVIKLQAFARMLIAKEQLQQLKIDQNNVIKLQAYARMVLAKRQHVLLQKRLTAVIKIQSRWRMVLARRQLQKLRNDRDIVIRVQAYARMVLAKRQSLELRNLRETVVKLQVSAQMALDNYKKVQFAIEAAAAAAANSNSQSREVSGGVR